MLAAQSLQALPVVLAEEPAPAHPSVKQETCNGLITCQTAGASLLQGAWNEAEIATRVAAAEGTVFVSDPNKPMSYLVHDGTNWVAHQLPTQRVYGSVFAAAGGLLIAGSNPVDVFARSGDQWIPHSAFPTGTAAATNGTEVAILTSPNLRIHRFVDNRRVEQASLSAAAAFYAMDADRLLAATSNRVRVYVRRGTQWAFEQELPSIWGQVGAVAIKGDTILVGFPFESGGGFDGCGAVYRYQLLQGRWHVAELMNIFPINRVAAFGTALALTDDYAFIGAPYQDAPRAGSLRGVVHVYRRAADHWPRVHSIQAPYNVSYSSFGYSIATADEHIYIGAPTRDCTGQCNGEAWAYDLFDVDCDCDALTDGCELDDDQDGVVQCDACPQSIADSYVSIGDCVTEVPNMVFDDGCTMSDVIAQCDEQTNTPPDHRTCIESLAKEWRQEGLIDFAQARQIRQCAGR